MSEAVLPIGTEEHRTTYTFNETSKTWEKAFDPPIFLRELKLEGGLYIADKSTLQFNDQKEIKSFYGTWKEYPNIPIRKIKVVLAFGGDRAGMLTLVYAGAYFPSETSGTDIALPSELNARY